MITPNIANNTIVSIIEDANPNSNIRQYCTQETEAPANFENTNITDYKIAVPKEDETQVFSKMKNSLPSVKDFLTLCLAKNQKLAADKLNVMLTNTSSTKVFNWQLKLVEERDFSFVGKDEFDNLNRPLSVAAKYDNIQICKVIVKHLEKESSPLILHVMSFLTYGSNTTAKQYNHEIKRNESKLCYEALCKALKYNNIETAEYLYDIYKECTKKGYSQHLNFIREQLLDILEKSNTISSVQFLLQKIDYLDRNYNADSKSLHTEILGNQLVNTLLSLVKKNNWILVAYIVAEHINIVKNATYSSQKRFLYAVLKSKKFDIAKDFIKKIRIEAIFNKEAEFAESNYFGGFTFLDMLKKDLDPETFDWLHALVSKETGFLIKQ